ncbi:MAG: hypothetical protein M3R36_12235 [Bacteroidota bacterium]|nr:hypothetical protein [Bacteroidota bacterium]
MKLLLTQKNQLFDLIELEGLSPIQFNIIETENRLGLSTRFEYANSGFFLFESEISDFLSHVIYSPGDFTFQSGTNTKDWNENIKHFRGWLNYLKREINAPDKWGKLQSEIENLNLIGAEDEDKFSASEYEQLKVKMETLKKKISELSLNPKQSEIINSKLDYLTMIALTLNKFDWKSLFIGTIISIIIQSSISPENSKALWLLIKGIFNNYFLP